MASDGSDHVRLSRVAPFKVRKEEWNFPCCFCALALRRGSAHPLLCTVVVSFLLDTGEQSGEDRDVDSDRGQWKPPSSPCGRFFSKRRESVPDSRAGLLSY